MTTASPELSSVYSHFSAVHMQL